MQYDGSYLIKMEYKSLSLLVICNGQCMINTLDIFFYRFHYKKSDRVVSKCATPMSITTCSYELLQYLRYVSHFKWQQVLQQLVAGTGKYSNTLLRFETAQLITNCDSISLICGGKAKIRQCFIWASTAYQFMVQNAATALTYNS